MGHLATYQAASAYAEREFAVIALPDSGDTGFSARFTNFRLTVETSQALVFSYKVIILLICY